MKLIKMAWLTDIHLNFLGSTARKEFYQNILETNADSVLITGDIGEANDVCMLLSEFSDHINKPIYFVLGNHDYYRGSVKRVRDAILTLCNQNNKLIWLGKPEIVKLNDHTVLVGHDGWADARYGNFENSPVKLNDSRYISELFQAQTLGKSALKNEMQNLADADAKILENALNDAVQFNYKKIIVGTHVPPFPECSWHLDNPSDENFLPFFASKAIGDVIYNFAQKHPLIDFLVLCGHTHTAKAIKPSSNLEVRAGVAEYYRPQIQELVFIEPLERPQI